MTGQLPFEIPNESQFIKILARLDILVATHRNSVLEKNQRKPSIDESLLLNCYKAIALCVIFMILVSLENVKKCVLGGCTITSKAKINVVRNIYSLRLPLQVHSIRKNFKQR